MPRPRKSTGSTTAVDKQPKIYCLWCGCANQANFYTTRDKHRKFFSKIPYCKDCVHKIFEEKKAKYNDNVNLALYYTLRKIDMPYIHSAYIGAVENINNENAKIQGEDAILKAYMKNLAFADTNGWGTSFDDSQGEKNIEGLTAFDDIIKVKRHINSAKEADDEYDIIEFDADELVQKWGQFDDDDLAYLESEYMDWSEQLNGIVDKSMDIIIKQVCLQCNEIRKDRQEGLPVEKKIVALQNLMKAGGLNDVQSKDDRPTSVGMNLSDIEFRRPIKQCDPELEDVDRVKMILDAYMGGTSKALGKDNAFTRRFDEEYAQYTIDTIDNLKQKVVGGAVDEQEEKEEPKEDVESPESGDADEQRTT